MDSYSLGQLIGGLVLLVVGGHLLVKSTSRLAAAIGIPPFVIGLTVVAFGTSAPELVVSLRSASEGYAAMAIGNVVGSNIFNVLFILGLAATITPLVVHQGFVQKEVPLLIAVSAAVWLLAADGRIGRWEGALLAAGLVVYSAFAIIRGRKAAGAGVAEYESEFGATRGPWAPHAALALVALGLLIIGSTWFVSGATQVARAFGIGELVIGLVIVAPGTSLPELATSVIAALKGERDIAVGNVVGSNLFNLLGVLGITAAFDGGIDVPAAALDFDFPVMFAATVACLPVFFTGHRVNRLEGMVLLAYYAAYVAWLLLATIGSTGRDTARVAVFGFAVPLTVLGLAVSVVRARRGRGRP